MRPRQGGRVRHAERPGRCGHILRLCALWDAQARRWEPAAWVQWQDGSDSPWPLRELVMIKRGERAKE